MRKAHRRRCLDVTVMRGAQCNTDHMMLKVKQQFGRKTYRSGFKISIVGKFDVSKLQGRCTDERGRETTQGKFVKSLCDNEGNMV